jgi:hypothetical protein
MSLSLIVALKSCRLPRYSLSSLFLDVVVHQILSGVHQHLLGLSLPTESIPRAEAADEERKGRVQRRVKRRVGGLPPEGRRHIESKQHAVEVPNVEGREFLVEIVAELKQSDRSRIGVSAAAGSLANLHRNFA